MREASRSSWYLIPVALMPLFMALPNLIGHRADVFAAVTRYRAAFEQVALVAAAAVMIAAITAGIRAWKSNHA